MRHHLEALNVAMEIVQQPTLYTGSAKDRLFDRFPELDPQLAGSMFALCAAVQGKASIYAQLVKDNRMDYCEAEDNLARDFPELDVDRIAAALNQAMYSCVR